MRIEIHIHPDETTAEQLDRMEEKLGIIIETQEIIMAVSDELKQAMADLQAQLNDNNSEIDVLMLRSVGTPDADVQEAIAQIRQMIAENKAKIDAAKAANPA